MQQTHGLVKNQDGAAPQNVFWTAVAGGNLLVGRANPLPQTPGPSSCPCVQPSLRTNQQSPGGSLSAPPCVRQVFLAVISVVCATACAAAGETLAVSKSTACPQPLAVLASARSAGRRGRSRASSGTPRGARKTCRTRLLRCRSPGGGGVRNGRARSRCRCRRVQSADEERPEHLAAAGA